MDIGWVARLDHMSFIHTKWLRIMDKPRDGNAQSVIDGNLNQFIRSYLLNTLKRQFN